MAEIIRMPRLSDTMEEGNIVGWLKSVGDTVDVGDILAEVETDKATMELESFQEGVLLYIGVKEGPIQVDGILAVIGDKGEDFQSLLDNAEKPQATTETKATEEPKAQETAQPAAATTTSQVSSGNNDEDHGRIKASPLAKSMAKDASISLSSITGTGSGGRIVKRDIEAALKNPKSTASNNSNKAKSVAVAQDFEYGKVAVSQMRKTIARRLSESKFNAPHFYLTIEINMANAIQARKDINSDGSVKISFNDLVIKASAAALQKHPSINSSWLGDSIMYHQDINIGVAVAIDEGLVVPVLRDANYKSLSQINSEVKDLATRARDRKLSLDEMQGNTFTISNLGMFGIEEFTAIINGPDACILAVGGIIQKPIVVDGAIVAGSMMKVTLSCDHRVVDGASGAKFLQSLKFFLENPVRILI